MSEAPLHMSNAGNGPVAPQSEVNPSPEASTIAPADAESRLVSPEEEEPAGPPLLVDPWAVVALAAAFGASIWFHLDLLTIALAVLLSSIGVGKLWSMASLRSVVTSQLLTYTRAFPGDNVDLVIRVENRKLLPMPWAEVTHYVAAEIRPPDAPYRQTVRLSLLWHQAATFHVPLTPRKRGYYDVGRAVLRSGDMLGLFPREQVVSWGTHLIVYPKLLPLRNVSLAFSSLFAERAAPNQLLYDPTSSAGTRDYMPGDPLRHINWKATARRPGVQVKLYEPSTSLRALLVLAVDSFEGRPADDLELAISSMASLAQILTDGGDFVGLLSNARLATGHGAASLPMATGQQHMARMLESLALVTSRPTQAFVEVMSRSRDALPKDGTIICVQGRPSAQGAAALESLRADGYHVTQCLLEGAEAVRTRRGSTAYDLRELAVPANGAAQ